MTDIVKKIKTPKKKSFDSDGSRLFKKTTVKSGEQNHSNGKTTTDAATETKNSWERREEYLKEKARHVDLPSEEAATITPTHLFFDPNPLLVHVCFDCRRFNAARPVEKIDDDHHQIPMALCNVCRSTINAVRSAKFFQYELPLVKRRHNL